MSTPTFTHITPCMKYGSIYDRYGDEVDYGIIISNSDGQVPKLCAEIDALIKNPDMQAKNNGLLELRRMFEWTAAGEL